MINRPRFMIAAAHKSSGKTVISAGLTAALSQHGQAVAPFKKGPDYIDPMWLRLGAGRPCYNLDFNTMSDDEIAGLFQSRSEGADVSLIEANKGLYDGLAADGSDSNAALAKHLGLPVVLVVDTKGMTRGIAPLLLGYLAFDPDVRIAGVILNRTGGTRHEGKLRTAVETYTDLPVLGAVGNAPELDISERHLGLTTPSDKPEAIAYLRNVGLKVGENVDLYALLGIAGTAPEMEPVLPVPHALVGQRLRIGIARDEAFAFYYTDDLEAFRAAGAELVFIDMIRDQALPEIDGLFIGGGYPEVHAAALSANRSLRDSLRAALQAGLPAYAECGGLMYLCRTLGWGDEAHDMVGYFDADTRLHKRPQGRGYVRYENRTEALWPHRAGEQRAHEFHFANLENVTAPVYARDVTRGFGIDGKHDGLVKGHTQAGFIHLRHSAQTPWVTDFLKYIAATRGGAAAR